MHAFVKATCIGVTARRIRVLAFRRYGLGTLLHWLTPLVERRTNSHVVESELVVYVGLAAGIEWKTLAGHWIGVGGELDLRAENAIITSLFPRLRPSQYDLVAKYFTCSERHAIPRFDCLVVGIGCVRAPHVRGAEIDILVAIINNFQPDRCPTPTSNQILTTSRFLPRQCTTTTTTRNGRSLRRSGIDDRSSCSCSCSEMKVNKARKLFRKEETKQKKKQNKTAQEIQ